MSMRPTEPTSLSPGTPLSPEDRHACAVCADWLATGALWSGLSLLSLVGFFVIGCAASVIDGLRYAPFFIIPIAVVTVVERVLAVRVAFDARLFQRLAQHEGLSLAGLDQGLREVMSVPASKAGRPVAARIRGARRLYTAQVTATLLLMAMALGFMLLLHMR